MSRENVEVVRAALEAWNEGDLDAIVERITSEFEFLPLRSQLEGGVYRGPEGFRQFALDQAEEWEFLRIINEEFRDLGDRVLVLGHFDGRGRGSGMDIRFPVGWVARLSDGKITHLQTYTEQEQALAAVGLSE